MREQTVGRARVRIFPDRAAWVDGAAQLIGASLRSALDTRGEAFIAISGGATPAPIYERLGRSPEGSDSRLCMCFVDERGVRPDDPQSNYRLANGTWFANSSLPSAQVHRMRGEIAVDKSAREYEATLRALGMPLLSGFPVFDVVLLGLGPDGHTASLFPGSPPLDERNKWVIGAHPSSPAIDRVTLTLPVLNAARCVVFLVAGADKRRVLGDVFAGDERLPAARVAPSQGELIWLLDEAAAP